MLSLYFFPFKRIGYFWNAYVLPLVWAFKGNWYIQMRRGIKLISYICVTAVKNISPNLYVMYSFSLWTGLKNLKRHILFFFNTHLVTTNFWLIHNDFWYVKLGLIVHLSEPLTLSCGTIVWQEWMDSFPRPFNNFWICQVRQTTFVLPQVIFFDCLCLNPVTEWQQKKGQIGLIHKKVNVVFYLIGVLSSAKDICYPFILCADRF